MSTPREIQAGVLQVSVLSSTLYSMCINDTPKHQVFIWPSLQMTLVTYAIDHKEGYLLRKLQQCLNSTETWWKRWNIKINEDTTWAIYFSHRLRPPEVHLTMNGRNIPFVNHVKYLSLIFSKRITWRLHIEMIEAKVFRIFTVVYSLFKNE
jgi:hypothetical protein